MVLYREHRGPLRADFHATYQMRLTEAVETYPLDEVADMVAGLPPGGALARAVNPEWWLTPEVQLLRDVAYAVRHSQWLASTNRVLQLEPLPMPLTDAERQANIKARGGQPMDAVPVADMAARLGWAAP